MKNRKTVVVAFLLIAVMLMGVGYAALTDVLTLEGILGADVSLATKEFDADIYFSNDTVDVAKLAAVSYESDADGNMRDTAIIEATGFQQQGDTVKVTLTIKNDSTEFGALVTPSVTSSALAVTPGTEGHEPVFTVTWEWDEDDGKNDAKTIPAGESKNIIVTITLLETPTEHHSATFELTFDAESVD